MATAEIIKKAIGRELEHKDLIDYFRKKYYMIYKL
jgi:Zn-dependent M32 family carboxypeptidase